ncbi:MAG: polysulfide reductase NrfD [Actinobacteria bacterium]|nr:polysulfide reductase NrfD [Actinomycetota bacterium]MBV8395791.1 polysulfide reductase NrfD [Actinomycetota bacterium]MBV8598523.1 polysulfide reductase NrfD [Actinomycetota bacterium]
MSITERGTEMQSYYGRPIVKEPVWHPEVAAYFFTGGIAGTCSVLHGIGRVTRNEGLAKTALYVGAAADIASPILLVKDLGRPERFLNMLRVFKVTSPMSVGSWILFVSGGASTTAALLELTGRLRPVKWAAEVASFLTGPPLATYTGALVANTAIPVWSEARGELPWLFGASAAASGGAATTMFAPRRSAGPARRAAILGAVAELGLTVAMERRLGFVGEVYYEGEAGKYGRVAKACTAAGATLLAARGRRSRVAAAAGSALLLAGSAALRYSVFKAGFQSARDPRYVVEKQRERLREKTR